MSQDTMTTRWRGEPLLPESYEDIGALVKLARKARNRIVEFDWELSRVELERLREAVHSWGSKVQGRYKKFDAQVLTTINEVLDEPDSVYVLSIPKRTEHIDSRVQGESIDDRYRLSGQANFDVIFGYGRAIQEPEYRVRLGQVLGEKLQRTVNQLGWDVERLAEPDLRATVNALYGLPLGYGIEEDAAKETPAPTTAMELRFHGPFHWNRGQEPAWLFGDSLSSEKGIYLWTVPVGDEERVHYVGQTRRSFGGRPSEHLAWYLSGKYSLLDAQELARGHQKVVWRAASGSHEYGRTLTDFVERHEALAPKIRELLNLFRFHLAPVDGDARLLDRIEGALGRHFRDHLDGSVRAFFGTGARFPSAIPFEKTALCRLTTEGQIVGIPDELIV